MTKWRNRALRERGGRVGGLIAASRMTAQERQNRASRNGNITLQKYGIGYYSALGKLSARRKRAKQAQDAKEA